MKRSMIVKVVDSPSQALLEQLDAVEWAADSLFRDRGIHFADASVFLAESDKLTGYYVIGTPEDTKVPIGFARVILEREFAHLEQLSVDPAHARRGYGRALVDAAVAEAKKRGFRAVTLRTYGEIPWNRPFYESCGFSVVAAPAGPFYERMVDVEEGLGLAVHGERVFMRLPVDL